MISVENLSKVYRSGGSTLRAVDKLSVSVEDGEYVLVTGRSGSGKTTFLSLLGGLTRPTSGKVEIDGVDLWRLGDDQLSALRSRKFGFVFQFASLIPTLTVLDNVLLPTTFLARQRWLEDENGGRGVLGRLTSLRYVALLARYFGRHRDCRSRFLPGEGLITTPSDKNREARSAMLAGNSPARDRAMRLLERVGIAEKARSYPAELSGGQQRRVAIARAFINSPKVILADEPTGDLDEETEAEVMAVLNEENKKGTTLIVVTHNPDLPGSPTKRLTMSRGKVPVSP